MNRRLFLKISSISLLPLFHEACSTRKEDHFDISVHNDMKIGHLTHESADFNKGDILHSEVLIIGGGLAGLSAAYKLRKSNFLLIELSDRLGGTSSSENYKGLTMAQGAHYDLSYPEYYGEEGLSLLKDLELVKYNPFNKLFEFTDRKYLIDPRYKENCLYQGSFREDVLSPGPEREKFGNILKEFSGTMPLPTRLIRDEFRHLNMLSFQEFIQQRMDLGEELKLGIDYNMRDDYGVNSEKISALAGIHYYQCRPYFTQPVSLFSPPEGNSYFVNKIAEKLDAGKILLHHLGMAIQKTANGFETQVLDVSGKQIRKIQSRKLIYAGQKHVLEYVFPALYPFFESTEYAPWMIVNLVLKNQPASPSYWQNEMLGRHPHLIGFVDASAQNKSTDSDYTFLTVFYNLIPAERNLLSNIEMIADKIAKDTINYTSEYFGKSIAKDVEKVFIKVMGHAMPIPAPGYLFNDRNENRMYKNLVYAGVDNGRLPLLFEAIDSGIKAAELIA